MRSNLPALGLGEAAGLEEATGLGEAAGDDDIALSQGLRTTMVMVVMALQGQMMEIMMIAVPRI